ncbi:bifunctional demethylmenaquinone methyltransferase/2-methoxy-6-polyprenyl-1,4-benzoquinol methylase UbiE, partial [Aliarcobacter butzleri]|nr:bifunctional demethylmenaquinone methyltransferase/2-methoxy-6-polyprenyl-1,4-benzoquinol methylase UbiE [Aliarcobacter butzleri]
MEKQEKIVSMFNNIAGTYDIANRVLSMGIDKSWRNKACNKTFELYGKKDIEKIVDVACGTGDMILFWQQVAKENGINLKNIIGIDPSVGMMEVGKKKLPDVEFIEAYATQMPLIDKSADIISISYGIRNVVQRQEAFDEFARVLKKDGLVVINEFTKNKKENLLDHLTDFYLNKVLPVLGGLISKNKEAYR